ncbi:MAG: hypothetical protein AAF603_02780 [Pseudomonadota bacterium]
MTSVGNIPFLLSTLIDRLQIENRLLKTGEVREALQLSEKRTQFVSQLENAMARQQAVPASLKPTIQQLLILNKENAALLQAAIAGQVAAKETKAAKGRPAGYAADGTRLFPVTEKSPLRF